MVRPARYLLVVVKVCIAFGMRDDLVLWHVKDELSVAPDSTRQWTLANRLSSIKFFAGQGSS